MLILNKPFHCDQCSRNFSRKEHLRRHLSLHSGEKSYSCPCGEAFSRSDVLSRHISRCAFASSQSLPTQIIGPVRRNRIKKACDRCAQLKTKCDNKHSCQRCVSKSLRCEYTREGTSDPPPFGDFDGFKCINDIDWQAQGQHPNSAHSVHFVCLQPIESLEALPDSAEILTTDPITAESSDYDDLQNIIESPIRPDFLGMSLGLNLDGIASQCESFSWHGTSVGMAGGYAMNETTDGQQIQNLTDPGLIDDTIKLPTLAPNCFFLAQIDPVEAKCKELNALLRTRGRRITNELINQCITREKLVHSIELFGRHFQRHFPIIHNASFSLGQAPRGLLLAMYCVGACYDNKIMTTQYILKAAMQVLMDNENQPHEENMDEPPLSAIQAGILACSVLATSQDEFAQKFVSVHFARNISMAKRARIFQSADGEDYNTLTLESFDWHAWIDLESRIRIANVLFTQNIADCIFHGNPPTFSPFEMDFSLPAYEASWDARSPSDCLQALQSTPRPELFSTVMQKLRLPGTRAEQSSPFEISSFGMFTLINGIHCLVWNVTKFQISEHLDMAKSNNAPGSYKAMEASRIPKILQKDFSAHTIESLAAEVSALSNTGRFASENNALDRWMHWWNARRYRDHDHLSFTLNPTSLWFLAKLYLLLGVCGGTDDLAHSEFVGVVVKSDDLKDKMQRQLKILELISRLRPSRRVESPQTSRASVASFMEHFVHMNQV